MFLTLITTVLFIACDAKSSTVENEMTGSGNEIPSLYNLMETIKSFRSEMKTGMATMEGRMNKLEKEVVKVNDMNSFRSEMKTGMATMEGRMNKLEKEVTKVSDMNSLSDIVFYPYGTTNHFALKHYVNYGLTFIGYGAAMSCESSVGKDGLNLDECFTWCYSLRKQDSSYDDLCYGSSDGGCECNKRGVGHQVDHAYLHYHFV